MKDQTILTASSTKPLWHRLAVLGCVTIATGSLVAFTPGPLSKGKADSLHLQVSSAPASDNARTFPSFAPVIKKVAPSVVKVSVTSQAKASPAGMPEGLDLRRFFGGEMPDMQGSPRQFRMPKQQGVGSGVIVTTDGYILTNNHVVENADDIKVALNDGREFSGKVIGRDPKTDVAVIKIDAKDLPAVTIADSDAIEVGDRVLAIGNPFGIGQTVTTGIVSAKGRATLGLDYEDFIQTDAAINPGNSGGALVDVDGRLIGMNTAILSHSGGNQGIGFAVPTNLARWVMESLVSNGRVDRGFLGVNIQDLTPQMAKEFKLDQATSGALVADVTPGSPAEKAGVKSGDLITAFNGKTVTDSRHLKLQVGATPAGASVPLKVLRDGSSLTLNVTVEALPGDKLTQAAPSGAADDALHGVAVADLDKATRDELKVPAQIKGAVISQLEQDSPAYEAGLREGDVITEINHEAIKSAEQATAVCSKPATKVTLVKVWSHGRSRYVVVDESKVG